MNEKIQDFLNLIQSEPNSIDHILNEPIPLGALWPDTVEVRNSDGLLITWV